MNLFEAIGEIISNLSDVKKAISSALRLPGLGLTYASKLLRFMQPATYGALDSRIRQALIAENKLQKMYDGVHNSMVSGYTEFISLLQEIKAGLKTEGILKPECSLSNSGDWRAAEIEMALFYWAGNRERR